MKKDLRRAFFIFSFMLLSIFTFGEQKKVTQNWITTKTIFRQSFLDQKDANGLADIDSKILTAIDNRDITENEDITALFIKEILVNNPFFNQDNVLKGLDILQKKFRITKYFTDYSILLILKHSKDSPFMVSKIHQGLAILLKDNYKAVCSSFNTIYDAIKVHYIYNRNYGQKTVITGMMFFLTRYFKFVTNDVVKENEQTKKNISEIMSFLGFLSGGPSSYENLKGAKELRKAYKEYLTD